MRQITLIAGTLALLATVAAADAQGIGYPPGVNPSNPQDLTYRSNPQDLTVPGGSNRQDLVRPSQTINGPRPFPDRREVTSIPSTRSDTSALGYTTKTKPKKKPRHRGSASR